MILASSQLRDLYNLFVSCSLYLVINTAIILSISAIVLGYEPFVAGIGFLTLGSLTAFVYITDRLRITDEDRINNPDRTALVERYETELQLTAAVSFVLFEGSLLMAVSSTAGLVTVVLGHVPLVVLAVYDRIKSTTIPLDSLAVAFAWAYEIVFILVFLSPATVDPSTGGLLFGCWFLIVFAGLETRNIKDIEGDREADKPTFACLFGAELTRRLGVLLKMTGALVLTVISGSLAVITLLVIHLASLRFYGLLETEFRSQSRAVDL